MVNESIYGNKNSWIPLSTDSSIKLANFGDDNGTIAKGFSTGKLTTNKPYDNSIVHSALGNESAISRMRTFKGGTKLTEDNFTETQWAFATGKNYFRAVDDTYLDTSTNMLSPVTNSYILNSDTIPIIDFSYKNIRAVIGVNAKETKTGGDTFSGGLSNYCENYATNYPYVTQIRITLFENIDGTWNAINFKGNKGIFVFNETSYFSKIRTGSKTFESGIIGSMMCCSYQSTSDTSALIIGGVLTQSDDRIYKDDIDIVSGDFEVFADSERGYFYYDTTNKIQEFREYCWKQTACFGIQFCEHSDNLTIDLESEYTTQEEAEKIFFGVLDDNFVGHGDFIRGKAIVNDKRYNKNADNNEYNPDKKTDPNTYHNTSIKPINVLSTTAFSTKYVMSFDTLQSIANQFYNALNGIPQDVSAMDYTTSLFLTNNALDTIVSCKYYPFNIDSTGNSVVQFGRYKTNVSTGQTNKKVVVYEFNCGSCFGEFGDFRDYEPYTTYELKIPFCASVRLNTAECVGKNISVSLAVDIETGSCTAFVYADNELIESVSGSCGVDIAISGIQQSTLDSQIFNASINNRQAKTNAQFTTAKGIISVGSSVVGLAKSKKSPVALTQGLQHTAQNLTNWLQAESDSKYSVERANYELSHVQVPYKCVGGVSSGVCLSESKLCVLIKETPVMLDEYNASIYGKTTGFACCINSTLSAFSGYTVCSDVDLTGINATENEKSMIKQILCTGFRL